MTKRLNIISILAQRNDNASQFTVIIKKHITFGISSGFFNNTNLKCQMEKKNNKSWKRNKQSTITDMSQTYYHLKRHVC